MGLFLGLFLLPEKDILKVKEEIKKYKEPYLEKWKCFEAEKGTIIISTEYTSSKFAQFSSKDLNIPVMYLCIYDGDFWSYLLYADGKIVDDFGPEPNYFGDVKNPEKYKGNAEVLIKYFPYVKKEQIENYLVLWNDYYNKEEKAYPEDEFCYCDCWQMADFMKKLGFKYPDTDII